MFSSKSHVLAVISMLHTLAIFWAVAGIASGHDAMIPQFPWNNGKYSNVEVRVLAKEVPKLPVRTLPPKVPYAYGWFGTDPSANWTRHFGHQKAYTQWSRR